MSLYHWLPFVWPSIGDLKVREAVSCPSPSASSFSGWLSSSRTCSPHTLPEEHACHVPQSPKSLVCAVRGVGRLN
ncbi:hypothetical protein E2C01_081082 [Portunus trituberculatus]|uniref:Uncharacterized protein n=1 Tax=Portunus trituberculatus TaxID=210409 RepID=A0A5B7IVN7_PORTR|nr:hypothetical protein [Portunus trituberculatus]